MQLSGSTTAAQGCHETLQQASLERRVAAIEDHQLLGCTDSVIYLPARWAVNQRSPYTAAGLGKNLLAELERRHRPKRRRRPVDDNDTVALTHDTLEFSAVRYRRLGFGPIGDHHD